LGGLFDFCGAFGAIVGEKWSLGLGEASQARVGESFAKENANGQQTKTTPVLDNFSFGGPGAGDGGASREERSGGSRGQGCPVRRTVHPLNAVNKPLNSVS